MDPKSLLQYFNMDKEYIIFYAVIGLIVLSAVIHIWKKYARKALDNYADNLYEKDRLKKLRDEKLLQISIESGHFNLSQILKKCHQRGYRDDNDRESFMRILKNYRAIGGDVDSEVMYEDFLRLPYKPSLRLPVGRGYELPDDQILNDMINIYNGIKSSRISKSSLHNIVKLIQDDVTYEGSISEINDETKGSPNKK